MPRAIDSDKAEVSGSKFTSGSGTCIDHHVVVPITGLDAEGDEPALSIVDSSIPNVVRRRSPSGRVGSTSSASVRWSCGRETCRSGPNQLAASVCEHPRRVVGDRRSQCTAAELRAARQWDPGVRAAPSPSTRGGSLKVRCGMGRTRPTCAVRSVGATSRIPPRARVRALMIRGPGIASGTRVSSARGSIIVGAARPVSEEVGRWAPAAAQELSRFSLPESGSGDGPPVPADVGVEVHPELERVVRRRTGCQSAEGGIEMSDDWVDKFRE